MTTLFERKLIGIRRRIHAYPELGNLEFKTSALIADELKRAGIVVRRVTKTGIVGLLAGRGGKSKRTIALRADIDALPIQERTGLSYASKRPGIMHACGHDANSTIVLGAALLCARRRDEFSGTIKFIFQPNEESSGGATQLLRAGVLKKPAVDAIVGVHVSPWLRPGTLGIKYGEMMAAVDRFTIDITGVGGHGAYPHLGSDAIVAASAVVTALQTVVSRRLDPLEPAVVTIGTIRGGERFNILCDTVRLVGTVRTLNRRTRTVARRLIERTAAATAKAYGAESRILYEELGSPLINTARIIDKCAEVGRKFVGSKPVVTLTRASMGGEDFAEYLKEVPGCFLYYGVGLPQAYPWHHEKFAIDESALASGAELMAEIALTLARNDQ